VSSTAMSRRSHSCCRRMFRRATCRCGRMPWKPTTNSRMSAMTEPGHPTGPRRRAQSARADCALE
jgi:hypothetical protein